MTFYTTTLSDAGGAYGRELALWLRDRLVDCGWEQQTFNIPPIAQTGTITSSSASNQYGMTDSSKNWVTNSLSGRYVYITGGPVASPTRVPISSNTATTISISAWANGTPTTGATYAIEESPYFLPIVLKSPGAANGLGSDFFVTLMPSNSAVPTTLYMSLHETWDSNTLMRGKFALDSIVYTASSYTVDTDFSATYTSALNCPNNGASHCKALTPLTAGKINLSASINHFLISRLEIGAYNTQKCVAYLGAFDSLLPEAVDPIPLVSYGFGFNKDSGTNNSGAVTRDPNAPAGGSTNWRLYDASIGASAASQINLFTATGMLFSSSQMTANPFTGLGATGTAYRMAVRQMRSDKYPRGLFKDAILANAGTLIGQTIDVTINGVVKPYILASSAGTGSSSSVHLFVPNG